MNQLDAACIQRYGFTYYFFNEYLYGGTNLKDESWREFMQHCTKGRIRTYTQRYQNDP